MERRAARGFAVRRRRGAAHPLFVRALSRAARDDRGGLQKTGRQAPPGGSARDCVAADGARRPGRARRPRSRAERIRRELNEMRAELLQLAADLAKKGEPFVLAMVVRRESYSSAQQGDMAVITADGAYHGWLGGNCTQPTVRREARLALQEGKPRLVSLSPDPETQARPGVTAL